MRRLTFWLLALALCHLPALANAATGGTGTLDDKESVAFWLRLLLQALDTIKGWIGE